MLNDIRREHQSTFLMGDRISYLILLRKGAIWRRFNQTVLYGRDVTIEDIIYSKRYPMMAERQVVIVKEAQDLSRTIDKLELCR
jgi:hypothetical protein